MSEETKNPETEKTELPEQELDSVAGGKSYLENRTNDANSTPATPPTPKPRTTAGGGS